MGAGVERIHEKIRSFNRKYYLNIFVRGALLSLSILISYFLLAAVLEYNLWLGSWARFVIMFVFFGVAIFCLFRFLREPMQWWIARRGLSEEQSAKVIGDYVPSVKDRLLNLIQLSASRKDSALAYASIEQKSREFESISFEGSIDLTQNRKYLKYLVIPVFIIVAILIINHSILTQSATRLVHFSQEYSPEAPFKFLVDNESLNGFYNENLLVKVQLDGKALPENVYLIKDNQRLKLDRVGTNGEFNYSLDNLREGFNFQIEAAGFYSDPFNVTVSNRPELAKFNVELKFPPYLQRKREALTNAGNLEVPEGTNVKWLLATAHAKHAQILMAGDIEPSDFQPVDEQSFSYEKTFKNPTGYEIVLENDKSKNKEKIAYHISVIKDEFPKIELNHFKDSVLYKMVVLSGMLSDDHGINKLALHYKIRDENQKELASRTSYVSVNRNQIQQSFFHPWSLDSLKLSPGTSLEYYMQVWDNDGVNGSKSTKTSVYTFMVPTEDNLVAEISKTQTKAQQKLDQSKGKANKLQDQIEQANQKLKGRQSLDWQDKKMLEDILEQKQGLDKMVDELKEENRLLDQKKDAFTEQNDRIREKAEQIQKLMDELLDEETKKLFDELQKLLKENSDVSQIQKILDKLNQNTNNLEKELERTLELFKQLQYDFKLDQTINDLKEQVEKQESLLKETEELEKGEKKDNQKSSKDKKGDNKEKDSKDNKGEKSESDSGNEEQKGDKSESEQLADDQQKLKEQFEKTKEKLDELKELGKDLDKEDEEMPSEEDANDVKQQQEESKEMLNQKSPSKSKAPQKKAIQKMQQMQQQMEGAQSSMSMEVDQQNLETLRHILHGLVKLSFDEEGLMKNFNELSQNDPAFNSVAQRQLKLKDDANVLEDSLLALGKRDPFMGSIVTREIGELNEHLDKVVEANKERRRPQASGEMQLTMTSINNLALMLDEHFDMMMEMMQNAQPSMGKGKKKGEKSSLSQMQQQLNQKIQELKGSGKSGRELSEELAEMAAEQERIRKALQEMQEKMKDGGKMPGGDLPSKMEQTEMDLVNKQLTDQLLKRQQDIVTRLLETEKSAREQDMDEERKGETAKDYEKEIPKAFEEYLRVKEKEVELLKTVPPKLYPYYKKEVSEYFKRVGEN